MGHVTCYFTLEIRGKLVYILTYPKPFKPLISGIFARMDLHHSGA
jgi:hypothetical protein